VYGGGGTGKARIASRTACILRGRSRSSLSKGRREWIIVEAPVATPVRVGSSWSATMKIRQGRVIASGTIIFLGLLILFWGYCCGYIFPVTNMADGAVEAAADPIPWLAGAGAAYWMKDKKYGLLYAAVLGIMIAIALHYIVKSIYSVYLRFDHVIELGLGRFLTFMFIVAVIDLFLQWKSMSRPA
jgi:hypothetical protein